MKWELVKDPTPYIESEDYSDESYSLVRRLYKAEGKKYPLFCISIHANPEYNLYKEPLTGIKISFSTKEKEGDWWDDYYAYLSPELFPELEEMLEEAKKKIK